MAGRSLWNNAMGGMAGGRQGLVVITPPPMNVRVTSLVVRTPLEVKKIQTKTGLWRPNRKGKGERKGAGCGTDGRSMGGCGADGHNQTLGGGRTR